MKIKAHRINELEGFGFVPCLGGIYIRKRVAVWNDGKLLKCPKSRDICYWKGLKSKRLIKDLIARGMVEEITP